MSGAPRNPDKLNTIGIVVVGVCGAVLVYVSIVALQAFYMGDTSDVQNAADYGGQETTFKSIKAAALGNISEYGSNPADKTGAQTFHIPIDKAMLLVVDDEKVDPALMVPGFRDDKPTIQPIYGRPKSLTAPATDAAGSGSAAAGSAAAGSDAAGSAAGSNAGSAGSVPLVPTGDAAGGSAPTGGTGALPAGSPSGTATGSAAPSGPAAPATPGNHAP